MGIFCYSFDPVIIRRIYKDTALKDWYYCNKLLAENADQRSDIEDSLDSEDTWVKTD